MPQTNKPTHHTIKLFYSSALLSNSSTQHPSLFSYELSFVAVNFKILYFKTLHTECTGLTPFRIKNYHVVHVLVCTSLSIFLLWL